MDVEVRQQREAKRDYATRFSTPPHQDVQGFPPK